MAGTTQLAGECSASAAPAATLVVFSLEDQRYALALENVERVLPMVWVSALPQAPGIVVGVINVHGRVLPVLDIRGRFGLPARPWGLGTRLLVTKTSHRVVALPVDEVEGVIAVDPAAVVLKPLSTSGVLHVAGIVGLADGLLFICDLEAFLSIDEDRQLRDALDRTKT